MSPRQLRWGLNFWPPFIGAGIRVRSIADDWREAVVEMRLGRFNRNTVGTHFGGSLFARVHKTLTVRLNPRYRPAGQGNER